MDKSLTVTLRLRNMLSSGVQQAGSSLKTLGSSVAGQIAGFVGLGAIIAEVTKTISVWSREIIKDERALMSLKSTLALFGEENKKTAKDLADYANKLQHATGTSNDETLAIMTQLRMMGLQTSKLKEASAAVIALTRAGMSGEQATRALAAAYSGNYEALLRYIPQLRFASTEAEKAALVNSFLTRQFKNQQDELSTSSGRIKQLAFAFIDLGKAIDERTGISKKMSVLARDLAAGLRGIGNIIAGRDVAEGILPNGALDIGGIKVAAEDIETIQNNLAENKKKLDIEQDKANADNARKLIANNEKEIQQAKKLADMTMAQISKQTRENKKKAKTEEKEREKYLRLLAEDTSGLKGLRRVLSKKDQEFMAKWAEREEARGVIGGLQGGIMAAEKDLAVISAKEAERLLEPLNELYREQVRLNTRLSELLIAR